MFSFKNHKKPTVVGILNITPDSFYEASRYSVPEEAIRKALEMQAMGAGIIDIGAVSTRPGSVIASEEEEKARLLPVVRLLLTQLSVPLSVDTFRPRIAAEVLDCGASIINDVSGYFNEEIARLVSSYSAGWILTHTGGRGVGSGESVKYKDGVLADVQLFFDKSAEQAEKFDIKTEQLCLDPGFGFSKNSGENIELLNSLGELNTHSCALLCALSRKRFISDYCSNNKLSDMLEGTLSANLCAYKQGAELFRVHDVKEHIILFNNIKGGCDIPFGISQNGVNEH